MSGLLPRAPLNVSIGRIVVNNLDSSSSSRKVVPTAGATGGLLQDGTGDPRDLMPPWVAYSVRCSLNSVGHRFSLYRVFVDVRGMCGDISFGPNDVDRRRYLVRGGCCYALCIPLEM